MFKKNPFSFKFGVGGFLFGVLLLASVLGVEYMLLYDENDPFSPGLAHYVFIGLPFVLGAIGWYLDLSNDRVRKRHDQKYEELREQSKKVASLSEDLIRQKEVDLTSYHLEEEVVHSLERLKEHVQHTKAEETKRSWVTEGVARFSDVLRSDRDDLSTLCNSILHNLVNYLEANQANLFLKEAISGEEVLELKACYAYDRKKYLAKTIAPGQGLVGQAYLEKERILLTDVPDGYMNLTSGLGYATPDNLVILPLKIEEDVLGIIEIASFKPFEQHHFELMDRIGEITASTLSTIRVNERTKMLLEDSQERTEQMRSQEEEMRQNMEELAATQEDTKRKEEELKQVLDELKRNETKQRIAEVSITIQSVVENAKMELSFLRQTPPILGILRARNNHGTDERDGSTALDWIERLQVILRNLLTTKKLYQKICFIDQDNELITGVCYDSGAVNPMGNTDLESIDYCGLLIHWNNNTVYISNPIKTGPNDFQISMYLPVYFENEFKGLIMLGVLAAPLLNAIQTREDELHHFALLDSNQTVLYRQKGAAAVHMNRTAEKISLNPKENINLSIVDVSH